jgi:hypothetical protein
LRKVGIQLVPDSLGEAVVSAFVWVSGLSILFTHWKNAAPAWLTLWLRADAPWSLVGVAALGCAVLTAISTAVVTRALPWFGIEINRESLAWTITGASLDLPCWVSCFSSFPHRSRIGPDAIEASGSELATSQTELSTRSGRPKLHGAQDTSTRYPRRGTVDVHPLRCLKAQSGIGEHAGASVIPKRQLTPIPGSLQPKRGSPMYAP